MARCIQTETNFTSTNLSSHNFIFIQTEAFHATATKPFQYLISCMAWNSRAQQQLPGTEWAWGMRALILTKPLSILKTCLLHKFALEKGKWGTLFQPSALAVTAPRQHGFEAPWFSFLPSKFHFSGVNLTFFPTDGWEVAVLSAL